MRPSTEMTPAAQKFGRYTLLQKLAQGGMGEIFLAERDQPEEGLARRCVIKRIHPQHRSKPEFVSMFFGEAKLIEQLHHPNIVQIQEMGEIDGDHYIAMEYVDGSSLRALIDEAREPLSLRVVHEIAVQLVSGLGYAHTATDAAQGPMNIVHRDVNPHNVLLSKDGAVKLIDFGIAKSALSGNDTVAGTIKGKFTYMSPEQSAAEPVDARSDLFSLGIVLYELLTLQNPFLRQNAVLSLEAIQGEEVAPPSELRPEAAPFDPVVMRALQKDPESRYASAAELLDALDAVGRTLPSEPPPAATFSKSASLSAQPDPRTPTATPPADKMPRKRLLGYALAFLVTVLFGFFVTQWAGSKIAAPAHPSVKAGDAGAPDELATRGASAAEPSKPEAAPAPETPNPETPSEAEPSEPKAAPAPEPPPKAEPSKPAPKPAPAAERPTAAASTARPTSAKTQKPPRTVPKKRVTPKRQRTPTRAAQTPAKAPAPAPAAQETASFTAEHPGSLLLSANRAASVSFGSQTRRLPTTLKLSQATGKLSFHGPGLPYRARLRYSVKPGGVAVGVDSTPWVEVRHNGVQRDDPRTPQGPFGAARQHRLTLQRPDSPSVVLTIRWRPDPR